MSSGSYSTGSSRKNWRKSSSCNSSSCPSMHLETWLRTLSSWTRPACTRRARAPAAPARPPEPPTTPFTPAALPPRRVAPARSRTTRVKRVAFGYYLRDTAPWPSWECPRGYKVPLFPRVQRVLTRLPPALGTGVLSHPVACPPQKALWGPPWPSFHLAQQGLASTADPRCTGHLAREHSRGQPGAKEGGAAVGPLSPGRLAQASFKTRDLRS